MDPFPQVLEFVPQLRMIQRLAGVGELLIAAVVAGLLMSLAAASSAARSWKRRARWRRMSAMWSFIEPRSAICQASSRSAFAPSRSPSMNRSQALERRPRGR